MQQVTLTLCLIFPFVHTLPISFLYSSHTPFDVLHVLTLANSSAHEFIPNLISRIQDLSALPPYMTLDYLYEEEMSAWAQGEAEKDKYVRMWGHEDGSYGWQLSTFLQALNFSRVLLVAEAWGRGPLVAESLYSAFPRLYRDFALIPHDADFEYALRFVGQSIKRRGINLVTFLVSPLSALLLLQALETKKLNKPGYAYILSQEAAHYRYLTHSTSGLLGSGLLVLAEEAEREESQIALEVRRLKHMLSLLEVQDNVSELAFPRTYELYYTNQSHLLRAARKPEDIAWSTPMLLPGNSSVIPTLTRASIRASVNYQVINPDLSVYPEGKALMNGYRVAFEEANNRTDLIPDYLLEDYPVGFTGMSFGYNFSLKRVQAGLKDLGLMYMIPPSSGGIIGMTKVFRYLNVSMPIGGGSLGSLLSSPKSYPLFIRPRVGNVYLMKIVARMVKFFGWAQVAILYQKDVYGLEDSYQQFMAAKDEFGINVTNPEDTRGLPVVLNNATVGQVNASLTAILKSTTRIILVLHLYNFVIMEQLYDLGVREGYVQVFVSGLTNATFTVPKRRVVSKGALMFFPGVFVGKVGQTVRQKLLEKDGSVIPNACYHYDVAYLYFYATQYLLETGRDYENPEYIMDAMRNSHFYGCGGFVKIQSASNDRDASLIVITNVQYDHDSDTAVLKDVGAYDPFSTQPYRISSSVQWPDDMPTYADSKPLYENCPFLKELVRSVRQGRVIGLSVDFAVAFVTLVTTLLIWRRWWAVSTPVLKKQEPIMLEDVLVLVTVGCDFFQFAAVGPELTKLSHLMLTLSASLGYDMEKLINVTNGVYWIVLDGALALVVVWTFLCFLKFTRLDTNVAKCWPVFEYWNNMLMPTLGHLLFLPIVSTLTNVYLCYQGTSERLTDSFLNKDCHVSCWQNKHLGYVVGSSVGLLCYIPLAVFTRPLWQELQSQLHVKAQPLALMVKSAVQVFLIVTFNTLQDTPAVHASIFIVVVSLYILFMVVIRQYNYDRLNLWQILIMVAMLSLSICAYITTVTTEDYAASFVIALALEYCLLIFLGLGLQHFLSRFGTRLVRAKSRDVRGLFRFAFTWGAHAQEGLEQFYSVNAITTIRKNSELDVKQ